MESETKVSIDCITYNHEKYIADAIEGFLMQETNFKYEIFIHDDASTDGTADIIKGYENKYPELIKPIYQTENQYSKGVRVGRFNLERAKSKYIALCEGDDYWIDPHKLQKQVDYMEAHPECSMCFHAAYVVDCTKRKINSHLRPSIGNKIYGTEEVIMIGETFATNSIMYPVNLVTNMPAFYENSSVGDYPMVIHLALEGTVFYFDEFMSAYRTGVSGSWSQRMESTSPELGFRLVERIKFLNNRIEMLKAVNQYTDFKYDRVIQNRIQRDKFRLFLLEGDCKGVKKKEYKEFYDGLGSLAKIKLYIKEYFPGFVKTYKTMKRKFRS